MPRFLRALLVERERLRLGKNGLPLTWTVLSRTSDSRSEHVQMLRKMLIDWFTGDS
ncbi:MAG: hypothetical protein OEU50_16425 [Gammaproteobacteria bacterium]|nr:hypothetical protein [Gammaproteobacteria bacterium]